MIMLTKQMYLSIFAQTGMVKLRKYPTVIMLMRALYTIFPHVDTTTTILINPTISRSVSQSSTGKQEEQSISKRIVSVIQ